MSWQQLIRRSWEENQLFSVLVELTYRCNWDCVFCYNDLGLRGTALSKEQYFRLLGDLRELGVLHLILSGGEPLAHPDFLAIGERAKEEGFLIRLKSNGHALRGELARRVKERVDPFLVEVSLHGASPQVHDRQTRVEGSFERLISNLQELKSLGYRLKINSVLTRWNEHQIRDMYTIADELGLPLRIEPEVTPRDDGDRSPLELSPSAAGIRELFEVGLERARKEGAEANEGADDSETAESGMATALAQKVAPVTAESRVAKPEVAKPEVTKPEATKPEVTKHCGAGSSALAIDPFGNVYPCVQWRRAAGNLHHRSIIEIWQRSPVLDTVREITVEVHERLTAVGTEAGRRMAFCPGSAELHEGDPLAIYDPARRRLAAQTESSVRALPVLPGVRGR